MVGAEEQAQAPRWLGRLLVVASALLLVAWCLREDVQPDTYFHLAAGRWIWEHGLPHSNVFLAPYPDHAFVDHEWLFQGVLWPIYQLGGVRALSLVKALGVLATFAAIAAACRTRGPRLRWVVLAAATLLAGGRFVLRPEVVSFLGVALTIYLLTRESSTGPSKRTLIALPIAQVLWSNAHGFALLGPVLVGVTLVARAIPYPERASAEVLKRTAALLGLVCAASLLNPYGLEAALYPFLVLLRTGEDAASAGLNYQVVELWSPFRAALADQAEIRLYKGWLLAAPLLWLVALRKGRSTLGEGARAAVLCASSVLYLRNLPFAALGLVPPTVAGLSVIADAARARLARSGDGADPPPAAGSAKAARQVEAWALAGAALACLLVARSVAAGDFHRNASYDPRAGLGLGEFTAYPEACDFLEQHPSAGGLFNNFGAGHYLIWRQVSPAPYLCGNTDLYPGEHLKRYGQIMRGERALTPELDREGISDVLLDHRVETPDALLAGLWVDPAWVLVHADRRAVLFRRASRLGGATPLTGAELARRAQGWSFPSEDPERFAPFRLLRTLRLLPADEPNPLHRLQAAHLLELVGEAEAGVKLVEPARQRAPDSPLVLRALAGLADAAGQPTRAEEAWTQLATLKPRESLPWVKRGLIALRKGEAREARKHFEEALERNPDDPLARQNLLAALELAGDPIGLRRAAGAVGPAKESYYRGVAACMEADWEHAVALLAKAVELDPGLAPALSRWAEVLGRLSRWSEAEVAWKRLCELTPYDASAWRALGRVRRVRDDLGGALAAWKRAAATNPQELEAVLLTGALCVAKGRRDDALAALREARKRSPNDPRVAKLDALIRSRPSR